MSLVRPPSVSWTLALALVLGALASCRTSDNGVRTMVREAGPADGPSDSFFEMAPAQCTTAPIDKKTEGSTCSCAAECGSGFCVHGVCCNSACNGTCMACNVPSSMGTCAPVPAGETPRMGGQCSADPASTCGLDGTCNGAGGCRKFVDGTVCAPGTCDGSSVVGAKVCSEGQCVGGPTTICSPFACDAVNGRCQSRCSEDSQCDGRPCVQGSCGKKPLGAVCTAPDECDSGSCADGVCCNVSCTGPCVSCNQVAKMGECSPVAAGARDPHSKCTEETRTTCGLSGLCNGLGGCAKHAAGTECLPASCSSGSEIPMSICDGNGTCLVGAPVACAPFICSGNSCKLSCTQASDCSPGTACTGGTCGKFPLGARCTTASECGSGFCVDGYCCDGACGGTCENCGLPTARGRCTAVGNGAVDPRGVCKDNGSTSCGTNGRCNGSRACQTYANGTPCKSSSCNATNHSYTQDGTCRNGSCSVPAATSCAPYKCNGANCGRTCGSNNDCQAPATCVGGSCGLKPQGSACSRGNECVTGQCAQGVCCNSACAGSCFSCNQTGLAGTCTAVPAGGPDPAAVCTNQGQASCGNDGTCNGLGGCRRYAPGSVCLAASCSGGVARAASTCNGTGTCVAGSMRNCSPFICNASANDCTSSCNADNQCAPPNSCTGTSCGKKSLGSACTTGAECVDPGQCVEGVCCNSVCTQSCKSCVVASARGTCTDVPAMMPDPKSMCPATGANTCGNDGFCNGSGACRAKSGTSCGTATCSGSTLTAAGTCSGVGNACTPGASTQCPGNFLCNAMGTACVAACTNDNQCTAGNICISGNCVAKLALGAACTGNSQCDNNRCVDGVCCSSACDGACQQCAAGTGACTPVNSGMDDLCTGGSGCAARTGACVAGACQQSTAACPSTCTGNAVQPMVCDGSGGCVPMGGTTPCPVNEFCTGAGVCGPCTMDAQCPMGQVCTAGVCM